MLSSRILPSIRGFQTSSRTLQRETPGVLATELFVKTRGKKLKPAKPDLVILTAAKSNILRKTRKNMVGVEETPALFNLDPFEFEASRQKLLEFKPNVSINQVISSIQYMIPSVLELSQKRYDQLFEGLTTAYTLKQLKAYIEDSYPTIHVNKSAKKTELAHKILGQCWKVKVVDTLDPAQDLLYQRIFDLSNVKMFLLLIQNTIQQWLRANVQVILIPAEFQLVVRANKAHLQYIELALDNFFRNIVSGELDIKEIKLLADELKVELPLDEIQRLAGVYFQPKDHDGGVEVENETEYTVHALGEKKFALAKRLMLWTLEQNQFSTHKIIADLNDPSLRLFKHTFNESLPWIHRSKNWVRLKQPKYIPGLKSAETIPQLTGINLDYKQIYESLAIEGVKPLTGSSRSITAVSFGNLLFDESTIKSENPSTTFQTQLPQVREKLSKLQQLEETDDLEVDAVDLHNYYAQIKFVPSPFNDHNDFYKHAPVEFWLDVVDKQASTETLQVFRVLAENNTYVSIPTHTSDMKFVRSETEPLIEQFDGTDEWLEKQPGIAEFLKNAEIKFGAQSRLKIPDYVEIKLPGVEAPVRYDYVSLSYRKHLSLKYEERMLEFSVIEGGVLGGRTSEALLIGPSDKMDVEEFQEFADDAVSFVKSVSK